MKEKSPSSIKKHLVPADWVLDRLRAGDSLETVTRELRKTGPLVSQNLVRQVALDHGHQFTGQGGVQVHIPDLDALGRLYETGVENCNALASRANVTWITMNRRLHKAGYFPPESSP